MPQKKAREEQAIPVLHQERAEARSVPVHRFHVQDATSPPASHLFCARSYDRIHLTCSPSLCSLQGYPLENGRLHLTPGKLGSYSYKTLLYK